MFGDQTGGRKVSTTNPKVDWFFAKAGQWQAEMERLRDIVLDCQLVEELKWGCPCYTFNGGNVLILHHFKEYCAILFVKGALLSDPENILIQQTENVQAARQVRFTNIAEVEKHSAALKGYIFEACKVEEAGLKVPMKPTTEFKMPPAFQERLDQDPMLQTAFQNLTPGRQRAYLLHFSSAKQAKTQEARIEKLLPKILEGKGLDD